MVVGTGRCGTSAVAKIVHESGISMGDLFAPPDQHNPLGRYEDVDFKNLNKWRGLEQISRDDWWHGVVNLFQFRGGFKEPWGFKDPRAARFIDDYITLLRPRFIWCKRDIDEVLASCRRCYTTDMVEVVKRRWEMLQRHLADQDVLEVVLPNIDRTAIEEFAHG